MVALLVLATIIVFLSIDYLVQHASARRAMRVPAPGRPALSLVPAAADLTAVPGDVFVAPGHAWVRLEPAGTFRIGTDRLPGALLGDVESIDLPAEGTTLRRGESLATLRRGDRLLRVPSPVSGTVMRRNEAVESDPASLHADPFERGWLLRVRPHDAALALRSLRVAEEARGFLRSELERLRDWIMTAGPALPAATLADGGALVDGLACRLGAETWNALVTDFFEGVVLPDEGPVPSPASRV